MNYEWHIVGDGPDLQKLKKEVQEARLEECVIFEGKQSNPFPYMKYADCLVMTSETEAFPMTLNEALISGMPVITTRHISAEEIVKEGINGMIASNSSAGIFEKVEDILNNEPLLEKLKYNVKNDKYDKEFALNQFKKFVGL
ncbi:MAG: glycosyltransferase [Cellulosilyticaceae bacterium]